MDPETFEKIIDQVKKNNYIIFGDEFTRCLKNTSEDSSQHTCDLKNIQKMRIYVNDYDDFKKIREIMLTRARMEEELGKKVNRIKSCQVNMLPKSHLLSENNNLYFKI